MITQVRHYSKKIHDGRTPESIFNHMIGECKELQDELQNGNTGVDGVSGEVADIIACAIDILLFYHPDITDFEFADIMESKLIKWKEKYG